MIPDRTISDIYAASTVVEIPALKYGTKWTVHCLSLVSVSEKIPAYSAAPAYNRRAACGRIDSGCTRS